jgi:hypothetical protein
MDENELNQKLEAFAEREKILNRLELRASAAGVEEPYLDDVRNHYEKRSKDGEDLSSRTIGDHIERLRSDKPRYFKASSLTSPATDGEKRKGTNGDAKVDHTKSSHADYVRFIQGFAPGVKV